MVNCNKENKNSDLADMGLKGNVKYIEERGYSAIEKFGKIEKDKNRNYSLYSFNKDGNIINILNSSIITTCKYDSKGNKIEQYYYELDGNLAGKSIYIYDSKGNMIEKDNYNPDSSLDHKYIYKYDSKGHRVEENYYNSEGMLNFKSINKYDSKGNLISSISYNQFGEIDYKETYKYDLDDNCIEFSRGNGQSFIKYDSKRNMIEENMYDEDGSLFNKSTYEYTYDNKDNWIKKIFINKEGNAYYIIERKIVYYGDEDESNYPEWDSESFKGVKIKKDYYDSDYGVTETAVETAIEVIVETPTVY